MTSNDLYRAVTRIIPMSGKWWGVRLKVSNATVQHWAHHKAIPVARRLEFAHALRVLRGEIDAVIAELSPAE